ncbi:urokinase plasminogen activator surface receptor-like [Ctenopharyngodon idella]|uniref:urokinase plasminogen activator surface receptor-like n=1 Tax=Ctenopharyngodon idella TaxID=7959 RepID=UPI0022300B57|nr:urokinase plasminogen activator surface receptor-like [Ctenopharyngodon idella]
MDLQISVFLLFILFTAGHSLSCYGCLLGSCTQTTCSSGFTNCSSLTYADNATVGKIRGCVPASSCVNGFVSFGSVKASTSCCNTDLCNSQDAPEPSNTPNGKKCYSCNGLTIQNCTNVLSCSETEDRCFKAGTGVNQTDVVKGCASKSVCDAAPAAEASFNIGNFTCCEGNLCNSAQSVSQSFLFLCCSLLSYFLLH